MDTRTYGDLRSFRFLGFEERYPALTALIYQSYFQKNNRGS
jgi:hypothetical protein